MVLAADPKATDAEVDEYEHAACPTCGSCSGMFTANSMNCLNEALGLALPGNGTIVATHADREQLFLQAGRTIVDLARRYYEHDDLTALPRGIATFEAFENAMTLDISMGGSTNTVLHLLAAAQEAQVPFTMADIDRLSRRVPNLCKVAPSAPNVHLEDVHRAGGIMAILGELDRAGLLHRDVPTVYAPTLGAAIDALDVKRGVAPAIDEFFRAAPFGVRTTVAFSQSARYPDLDLDRDAGVIRNVAHAFSKDGGLAVLYGNIAEEGCIVKTAGVDAAHLTFTGPARIFESQDSAVEAILGDRIVPGDVVLIRYEGPRGGPGMQEMLYPTSYLKSKGLGKVLRPRHRRPLLRRRPPDFVLAISHRKPRKAAQSPWSKRATPSRSTSPSASSASTSPTPNSPSAAPPWKPKAHPHGSPQPARAKSRRPSRPTPPSPPAPPAAPSATSPASRSSDPSTPFGCPIHAQSHRA